MFKVRNATRQEWSTFVINWANTIHQWNVVDDDLEAFFSQDPNGFFVGTLDDKIICSCSGIRYGNTGFIGYYICDEMYRGKGFGIQVFKKAMEHLNGVAVALDGVEEQMANYQKSGFKHTRWCIRKAVNVNEALVASLNDNHVDDVSLQNVNSVDPHLIQSYDCAITGMGNRNLEFVNNFINRKSIFGLVTMDGNGNLSGIICARKSHSGYRIGPFYANSPKLATALLKGILSDKRLLDQTVYCDTAVGNNHSEELFNSLAATDVFKLSRMWTDPSKIREDTAKLYGSLSVAAG